MFGPYDRELPFNVNDFDFEPLRDPGVHVPAGDNVDPGSPSSLFLLFFGTVLVNEIVRFTNMKGKIESEKVKLTHLIKVLFEISSTFRSQKKSVCPSLFASLFSQQVRAIDFLAGLLMDDGHYQVLYVRFLVMKGSIVVYIF